MKIKKVFAACALAAAGLFGASELAANTEMLKEYLGV